MWHLKKYNKGVNETKQKQIHRNKEQTGGYQWREGSKEEQFRCGGKKGLVQDYMKSCV